MKKIIIGLLILLSISATVFFQAGGPRVDAIKFRGKITTTIRNTLDVPAGETWLIHNVTSNLLETASSDDVWSTVGDGLQAGINVLPTGVTFQQGVQNTIELIPENSGLFNNNPAVRIIGGSQPDGVFFVLSSDLANISNYSIADINAGDGNSVITKEWTLAEIANVTAVEVNITDAGGNFTSTETEGALTELADDITAISVTPASQFGFVTYTANQTALTNHVLDSLIVILDYDNETFTIPSGVFSSGQAIRILNGASGTASIVAGSDVTLDQIDLHKESESVTIARMSTATAPEIWSVIDGNPIPKITWLAFTVSTQAGNISVGTNKGGIHMPFGCTPVLAHAGFNTTNPTGSVATFDINEDGITILSTKITVDATEEHSNTAAISAVISDNSIAQWAYVGIDIDGVGSTLTGAGGIVYLGVIRN